MLFRKKSRPPYHLLLPTKNRKSNKKTFLLRRTPTTMRFLGNIMKKYIYPILFWGLLLIPPTILLKYPNCVYAKNMVIAAQFLLIFVMLDILICIFAFNLGLKGRLKEVEKNLQRIAQSFVEKKKSINKTLYDLSLFLFFLTGYFAQAILLTFCLF